MENQTIDEVYSTNDQIQKKLKSAVENVSEEKANVLPEGEKWTLAALVEHVGTVDGGMLQICRKLLSEINPGGEKTDGAARLSDNFKEKAAQAAAVKLEAPERVQPKGGQTIAESLAKMDENRAELEKLRPLFVCAEGNRQTFPHPFMGDLTAHEWLVLIGGHKSRHLRQINEMLVKIN